MLGIDFICYRNAAIQCGDSGIEIELESEDRNIVTINAIMLEQEAPDITINCMAEEMDSFFGILNITEEEIDESDERRIHAERNSRSINERRSRIGRGKSRDKRF